MFLKILNFHIGEICCSMSRHRSQFSSLWSNLWFWCQSRMFGMTCFRSLSRLLIKLLLFTSRLYNLIVANLYFFWSPLSFTSSLSLENLKFLFFETALEEIRSKFVTQVHSSSTIDQSLDFFLLSLSHLICNLVFCNISVIKHSDWTLIFSSHVSHSLPALRSSTSSK